MDTVVKMTAEELLELSSRGLVNVKYEKEFFNILTEELWEECFNILKDRNIPSEKDKKLKRKVSTLVIGRSYSVTNGGVKTLDEYYVNTINDSLDIVRGKYKKDFGLVATVYKVEQIKDILRFEPELKSRYINDGGFKYFEIWL